MDRQVKRETNQHNDAVNKGELMLVFFVRHCKPTNEQISSCNCRLPKKYRKMQMAKNKYTNALVHTNATLIVSVNLPLNAYSVRNTCTLNE